MRNDRMVGVPGTYQEGGPALTGAPAGATSTPWAAGTLGAPPGVRHKPSAAGCWCAAAGGGWRRRRWPVAAVAARRHGVRPRFARRGKLRSAATDRWAPRRAPSWHRPEVIQEAVCALKTKLWSLSHACGSTTRSSSVPQLGGRGHAHWPILLVATTMSLSRCGGVPPTKAPAAHRAHPAAPRERCRCRGRSSASRPSPDELQSGAEPSSSASDNPGSAASTRGGGGVSPGSSSRSGALPPPPPPPVRTRRVLLRASLAPALALAAIGSDDATTILNSVLSGYGLPTLKPSAGFKVRGSPGEASALTRARSLPHTCPQPGTPPARPPSRPPACTTQFPTSYARTRPTTSLGTSGVSSTRAPGSRAPIRSAREW